MSIPFPTIRTERLVLRVPRLDDVDAIHAYRDDPVVARYQDWMRPYDRSTAVERVQACIDQGGPAPDSGWNLTIADADDSVVMGDLYVGLRWGARNAEIGYTLAAAFHGQGFAREALDAIVDWLFVSVGVTRIGASLHPENMASARLLERTGFGFEGETRLSFWLGDENSDDWIYGLTRDDWDSWQQRPTEPPDSVELVEITEANQYAFRRLTVAHTQERFVAPVVASMADALYPEVVDGAPLVPWLRGVRVDGQPAAFVMLALVTEAHPEPYLWRFLVDHRHQGRGIGRRALELVFAELRSQGASGILTSWVEGRGSPRPFYEGLGFVPTGRVVDGETEARLAFQ